ncbi:VOC family protein [Halomarina ordinaria]|uniref:VOC family protein n=1 Tax=Halomarina ordinaria TaxID=3033939 RepID=A0ABD5UFR6_9EURY|nr:VOC family protein [Halomarina sp. PSRA2]
MDVVSIDRIVIATDNLDRTAGTLTDRLDLNFGELLTLTTETAGGTNDLQSVIDTAGIGIDVVEPSDNDSENAVARFIEKYDTGLYAIAFRVADLEAAAGELADDGVEPVGEISAGEFTEYLYHPRDFDGLFIFLAEFPHAFEAGTRLAALEDRL